jgi:carboxymethylenebutenolidase
MEEMTTLTSADGFSLEAFRAAPTGDRKGGLVIIQEIFGITEQLKSVARSYASDGFETVVPGLFDRAEPGTVVPFDDPLRGRDLMAGLDEDKVLLDLAAAVKSVQSGSGVSVVGFCWGGGLAYRAACELDLKAAVSYYGTRLSLFLDRAPRCPMLFHFGETDSHSPPEIIEAVRKAVPSAETHIYAAGHAFANDVRTTYVKDAAEPARERTLAFLNKHHP